MNGLRTIDQAEFRSHVLEADLPVLVDFFAPWCGPCKMLAPTLDVVARNYKGRLNVVKVNVDEAPQLAADYEISGVPTLLFFKDGEVVDTIVGMPPVSVLQKKLEVFAAPASRVEA